MGREAISVNVQRRLLAESMGRCMNPTCQKQLFIANGDIIERAHIVPYCKTADNSFENLVILCPSCHTAFDKNAFSPDEVREWKQRRSEEMGRIFQKRVSSFDELKEIAVPLLMENKLCFERYYLQDNRALWDQFEPRVLVNNRKLSQLFKANLSLFQGRQGDADSNLEYVYTFLQHVREFEATRPNAEKTRCVLFPPEIDSIFGIEPVHDSMMPLTESLEVLIGQLLAQDRLEGIELGIEQPYIQIRENGASCRVFLDDKPRLQQLYHDYHCFRKVNVRLESLNFALRYIRSHHMAFSFIRPDCLREIRLNGVHMLFVYEYCLSKAALLQLMPEEGTVIVNLHNWNGESCISQEAYAAAETMNVTLLTMAAFYGYIKSLAS